MRLTLSSTNIPFHSSIISPNTINAVRSSNLTHIKLFGILSSSSSSSGNPVSSPWLFKHRQVIVGLVVWVIINRQHNPKAERELDQDIKLKCILSLSGKKQLSLFLNFSLIFKCYLIPFNPTFVLGFFDGQNNHLHNNGQEPPNSI